ncbi:MAG: MarC family protein [Hyphomicrobiales bacterium]|nr:MAG: MarC family protein [Hyphomicrobiales bacterium]
MFNATVASFLLAFSALFSIVNPLGGALIYSQVTASRTRQERVQLAWRVATYSGIVMLTALLAGAPLLGFFGISLSALRIAGGLVVAAHAWELLSVPETQESRKTEQAAPAGGTEDVAFFPLTLPFTTGPGTIAVAIALSANGPPNGASVLAFYLGSSLAALLIALIVGVSYSSADRVVALLGQARSRVVTRLAAFILLCVGVQILVTGVNDALAPLLAARP